MNVPWFKEMACFCSRGGAVITHAARLSLPSIYSKLSDWLANALISPVEPAFCLYCSKAQFCLLIVTRECPLVRSFETRFRKLPWMGLLSNSTYVH